LYRTFCGDTQKLRFPAEQQRHFYHPEKNKEQPHQKRLPAVARYFRGFERV
jgi:hypothetical protein